MKEFCWVADHYCDAVKQRKRRAVERDMKYNFSPREWHVFDTEAEAWQFVLCRAEDALATAKKDVVYAERRLKKCRKRLYLLPTG